MNKIEEIIKALITITWFLLLIHIISTGAVLKTDTSNIDRTIETYTLMISVSLSLFVSALSIISRVKGKMITSNYLLSLTAIGIMFYVG